MSLDSEIRSGLVGKIREFSQVDKARIVRAILDPVAKHLNESLVYDKEVKYSDGSLFYPEWLLSTKGKTLAAAFGTALGATHAIYHKQLRKAYEQVSMVPEDLVTTLRVLSGAA